MAQGSSVQKRACKTGNRAPALENKVFVYYEIRDGGPSPSSLFPLPQLPPPFLSFPSPPPGAWEAHKTMPRAGMPRAGQQLGRAPGRRPGGGLELSPWEVGWHPLSAGGQWSQDEAMSDGWNHAGRSVKTGEPGVLGGEWRRSSGHLCAPPLPTPLVRGTDLGPNIPRRRVGSSGWKFLLLLGWTTEKTEEPVTGTQRECRQMWAGDRHRACVWARETERGV